MLGVEPGSPGRAAVIFIAEPSLLPCWDFLRAGILVCTNVPSKNIFFFLWDEYMLDKCSTTKLYPHP